RYTANCRRIIGSAASRTMTNVPWSDSWLLLSLIYAREPSDVKRIRAIGDFINHAVFTTQELRGGFRRLVAAGHVKRLGKKYVVSSKVLKWYDKETKGKRNTTISKDIERTEAFLALE